MATLTLDEFLTKARPLNPEYSDSELIQAYQERYAQSPTHTVSAAPLMTLNEFLPKARKLNPEYSDDELTAAWQEKYGARGAKESNPGFSGTLAEGAKSTGRSLKAAAQTATGNLSGVEETAKVESEKDPALQKILADIQIRKNALGKDPSWWQSLKAVGGAVVDNPKGAAMLAVEQLPNSAVALGSAGAGALAGSVLGPAGTVAGGIAGLFLGNTAIETGSKAIEKAGDGFTPGERAETLKEGAIKGGVVTGFDAATFGLTKWLTGTVARSMERATINVLEREGIDTTNKAAVQAARQNPEIVAKVQQAQETARAATNTLGKKLARGAGEVGSEAIGEGAGEYIGEVAATGKGDKVEAVIEALSGLGQSGAEIAVAQGMSRKQQKQGSFGDVTGQPIVTERTPDQMDVQQPEVLPKPLQVEGPIQPGEVRGGKVYGSGPILDVSPLPDVSPITQASSLDEAIANAVGVVRGATETGKARAAEFARMTAKAKNETDALLANAPEKRQAFDVPTLPGPEAQPATLLNQPSPIVPGQAFTPRPEPVDDPRARLAEERARMVAQREQQRLQRQANPVSEPVAQAPSVEQSDTPLPSQIDLAYPSSKQVRDLIHEKGFHLDTPVFREILKQAVGKEKFADLTPQELQTLAEKVQKIKAPQSPTQTQEAPPQVPLTPPEPNEKPYAPVTTIPEAQVPRSELTPEKNAEMLLRAEKAKADLEVAGTERGGRFFQEQQGAGSTQDVTGLKSATADWYKDLTSGPSPAIRGDRKQSAREKIESAIQKIIKDQGADRGKAVEQVKAALLADTEFHKTEWGRDLNSIMQGEWPSWVEKPVQSKDDATASWVIRNKTTGEVIQETFNPQAVDKLNKEKYEAIPAQEYLGSINTEEKRQANAKEFQKVPQGTTQVTDEVPKPVKVPKSRTQKLAEQKQKMEAKKPEPSPSNAPEIEPQPATASPERAPAPSTQEAAPKTGNEPVEEKADELQTLLDRYKPGNPFALKAATWRIKADRLNKPTAYDKAMEQSFPLGGGYGRKGGDKRVEARINRATQAVEAEKNARHFESSAELFDRGMINAQGRTTRQDKESIERREKGQAYRDNRAERIAQAKEIRGDKQQWEVPGTVWAAAAGVFGGSGRDLVIYEHREAVKEALAQGKPVPQNVLDEYPDLEKPEGEPFSLSSPEVSKPKAKDTGPEQLGIDIPPETIGSRPIIGREATLDEAPLFSKNAQTPDAEQTSLSEPLEKPDESPVIPKQDSGSSKEPWQMTRQEFKLAENKPKVEAIHQAILSGKQVVLATYNRGFRLTNPDQIKLDPSGDVRIRSGKEWLALTDGQIEGLARQSGIPSAPLQDKAFHRSAVREALDEGKPVPVEVLADYPDLQQVAEKSAQLIAPEVAPAQSNPAQSEKPAQSPTEIIAEALRTAADRIAGKPSAESIDTVDKYQAFRKRLLDGEVTLDEYREAFRQVNDNKDALLAGLKKLNKDQLVKISNSFHTRKSESKDSLIAQAYDGMLRGFALGRGVSYAMTGKGSYENAMAKLVEQTTADDLAKFAEEVSKNTAEYKARVQGVLDPKTLEDFDARVRIKGEASLTPEQLARYDELLAQAGREKRKQAQEQKATVQGVDAGTDLQLIESKHTKTGDKLWVVKLANRVDRAVYDRLNQAAHKLGGRYSSYNKDGAIPGFTFRSEEAAKSFMAAGKGETVSAAPIREAAKAEVQNNAVSKLREMADNLAEKADESLNADRKTNTAKRARQASHAENDAYANKALAETMRNLADAIESGEATHLSGLRTKAQVEMLDSMLEQAKNDRIRKDTKGSYVDYERQKHRKAEPADAAEATFPTFTLYKEQLNSALAELKDVKGTERLRMRLSKIMSGVTADGKRDVPREDAELALEKRRPSKYPPAPYWQWESAATRLKRLESMGITSLPELRAALREYVEYRGKRGTIDKAKQLERNMIGNKGIGNDFFPTPKETAQRMVAEAGIEPGMKVLEPSAGNGNIAEVIRAAGVNPDVVEQSSNLREILEAKGFNVVEHDFMDVKDGGYDRIVMNPPFSNGQDAEHIHHAYTLLKPGGKLVAIAGEGIFFRNDAKATAFRKWLDEVGGASEKLPEGTFKDASLMATTGVNARMVTIEKPVEEEAKPDSFLSFLMDERGSIPASIFGRRKGTEETGTIDPTDARDRLAAVKTSTRPYLLGALGLEQLSQVYGDDHAEVKAYNQATQAMEADFTEMSRESDKVARAWTDLKIPVADKMAQVMEDARFLNFDPDPRKKQEADSEKKKALRTRFEQLPEDAQAVYRMARDFYTNMAEQRFQALKERIERAGGTPENTRKLVDRLQIAYEQVRSKVYFPFTRFGENIVVAKKMENGVEKDREVHAFESVAEAQKFATMMKLKGWQVKQTVAREYSVDKEGPASKIVRDMHDIIKELGQGQQGLPGVLNLEDQLLDSLNQSFLQALPDMSYAKHFIHAKDVKGASKDALRSFSHSALHGAHHISRIRHADKVTKALMDLDQNINETAEGDTTEARQVYNELVKRHNDIMNPNTHPVSAWLGQLGFTMSLGGVVATGITNATQVPLVTYPWLGARYGFGKASTALARAYKDFLDPRTLNKDSLFDATKSKLISESERKMLLELARRGHIDLTQTMDLAGLSSRDNLSRKARTLGTVGEKVTRMLGFTFHVPEVMNRQVTALSTFRLEKENGGTFEEALERAQQAIQDTHFIYQSFNRPRYMQGNFLRVLTMFKQYSQNIAYTYGRAASIWLDKNNATKEERRVAKRQLASMLTLQFGAAGALGMPFFGTPVALIMHALGAMDDDDDDQDWEVSFRKWLDGKATSLAEAFIDDKTKAREVGKEMAEVVSHGASRLTPWDMAARLGQNDLFFREPQREREGRSAVMDWMMALGGPVPSYGVNFLLGMGDVAKGVSELNAGFFMRGVEELTPAVLRNGVKSLRYTLEGVRTRDEYKQLDLNTSEQLGQAFGFTPARVAEMYESTTAVKNKEHRVLNQQKALKDRFARAVDDQDDTAKQNILDDIRGFNERNPMFAITSNTLNRSIKTRRQHEAGMERGMYLPPRRRALMDEGEFGDF